MSKYKKIYCKVSSGTSTSKSKKAIKEVEKQQQFKKKVFISLETEDKIARTRSNIIFH